MNLWFFASAALMLAAALACAAVPLLRAGRRSGRTRAPFVLALILVFALPPAAIGLYAWFGTPSAVQPQAANGRMDLAGATAELRSKLQSSPNHPEGWLLLAQAYTSMGRLADAREAFGQALKLRPGDPDIMVAYAEADAQARADHRIDGESRKLLQRAIALQPDHQRGLWLLGISDYQLGRYDDAVLHWQQLSKLMPADSKLAAAVKAQIAMAQARAQGKTQAQAETIASQSTAMPVSASSTASNEADRTPDSSAVRVEVRLDPKFKSKVSPNDTLFVFARSIDGPPMPLAVARLSASNLPASVTLTDAMAMTPQLKLSSSPHVQVSARISRSGDAIPHTGDLEARPVQAVTGVQKPVVLTIDRVH